MSEPSGEVVARPMLPRACGCVCEFQYYKVDRYRAQRQAKFQGSRCPACVRKSQEEQRRSAGPPKGEALKALPPGTRVTLTLSAGDVWKGALSAGGREVEAEGPAGAGPGAVVVALARLWAAGKAGS